MDPGRRRAARTLVAAALAPGACAAALAAPGTARAATAPARSVNVILPRSLPLPADGREGRAAQNRLARAVLDSVRDHYKGKNLPVWRRRYGTMDLEKRVANICYWILKSVRAHAGVHPVPPAWVAAQIMTESFFYEFAVSRALAVGICQFIPPTAEEYGMVCAGSRPGHAAEPYARAEWAVEKDRYYDARKAWKKAMRARRAAAGDQTDYLRQALLAGRDGGRPPRAEQWLKADAKARELDEQVKEARERYQEYLRENFKGRSIFDDRDVAFFKGFDERVLYRKPVDAMVLMLARFLHARSGNILSAAAGYHCGLSGTRDEGGPYAAYGRLPAYEDTVTYVSRILVNHHEIAVRMA